MDQRGHSVHQHQKLLKNCYMRVCMNISQFSQPLPTASTAHWSEWSSVADEGWPSGWRRCLLNGINSSKKSLCLNDEQVAGFFFFFKSSSSITGPRIRTRVRLSSETSHLQQISHFFLLFVLKIMESTPILDRNSNSSQGQNHLLSCWRTRKSLDHHVSKSSIAVWMKRKQFLRFFRTKTNKFHQFWWNVEKPQI